MTLNKKQRAIAIDLATGITQRRAAKRHGIHFMTITLWKRRSDFIREIERLRRQFRKLSKKEA